MESLLTAKELAQLEQPFRDIFSDGERGRPDNVTGFGAFELAKHGALVWNKWRTLFPVQKWEKLHFLFPANNDEFNFSKFNFPRNISFEHCRFYNKVFFNEAVFAGDVTFTETVFSEDVDFSNAVFQGAANFKGTIWVKSKCGTFKETKFLAIADFSATSWHAYKKKLEPGAYDNSNYALYYDKRGMNTEVLPHLDFTKATFLGRAIFDGREFSSLRLENTVFHKAPEFIGSKLHHRTLLKNTKFPKEFGYAVNEYRVLKNAFAELKNTRQELRFFRREMQEEMHNANGSLRRWLQAYQFFSDFGFSVCRPLMGLIALFFISLSVSLLLAYRNEIAIAASPSLKGSYWESIDWGMTFKYISFSFGNALPFFSGGKFDSNLICELFGTGAVPEVVKIIALGQQCLSLVFWFLVGLAIRNKFKLK